MTNHTGEFYRTEVMGPPTLVVSEMQGDLGIICEQTKQK